MFLNRLLSRGNDLFSFAKHSLLQLVAILRLTSVTWAAVGGSISRTVKDFTGGMIPGAMITVTNTAEVVADTAECHGHDKDSNQQNDYANFVLSSCTSQA